MVKRVMWLLNHGAARKFEIPMLKRLGFNEIFLPKSYPCDIRFRSASVDYTEDQYLTIPEHELAILNAQDWYSGPSREAWGIANKYFQILFFILHDQDLLRSISRNFKGVAIWRAYGLDKTLRYSILLEFSNSTRFVDGFRYIEKLGNRFVFGQAYSHLHTIEKPLLSSKKLDFPAGLDNCEVDDQWIGTNKTVFFVCPEIGFSSYYQQVYNEFHQHFGHLPYAIAGSQPIKIEDKHILGFVTKEEHARNMREMRVMFYHSTEPNHIHYHPFEAIRAGMPLVFMAGGILDTFGGKDLPGRCRTIQEAQEKIARILADDYPLIESIRRTQPILLEPMREDTCYPTWYASMQQVQRLLADPAELPQKTAHRIAFFVSTNTARNRFEVNSLACMLFDGAEKAGKKLEIIIGYFTEGGTQWYEKEEGDLSFVQYRPFTWKKLDHRAAFRALTYAGFPRMLSDGDYYVPDDGINNFLDCQLWIFQAAGMKFPLLPIRPYIMNVFDYAPGFSVDGHRVFSPNVICNGYTAEAIFTLSDNLAKSLVKFIGLPERKVNQCALLPLDSYERKRNIKDKSQFLWFIELASGQHALEALRIYYNQMQGALECCIIGCSKKELADYYADAFTWCEQESLISFKKAFSVPMYQKAFAQAQFIWHPVAKPRDWFMAIEATQEQVPFLACEDEGLRKLSNDFSLQIVWMPGTSPMMMAEALKMMENTSVDREENVNSFISQSKESIDKAKYLYWEQIEECL